MRNRITILIFLFVYCLDVRADQVFNSSEGSRFEINNRVVVVKNDSEQDKLRREHINSHRVENGAAPLSGEFPLPPIHRFSLDIYKIDETTVERTLVLERSRLSQADIAFLPDLRFADLVETKERIYILWSDYSVHSGSFGPCGDFHVTIVESKEDRYVERSSELVDQRVREAGLVVLGDVIYVATIDYRGSLAIKAVKN